jgi:hypothetical protein
MKTFGAAIAAMVLAIGGYIVGGGLDEEVMPPPQSPIVNPCHDGWEHTPQEGDIANQTCANDPWVIVFDGDVPDFGFNTAGNGDHVPVSEVPGWE